MFATEDTHFSKYSKKCSKTNQKDFTVFT